MKAKKSLGQNFLTSTAALATMITTGEVGSNDTVVEIGPGKGILTTELLKNASKVIAIEKDHTLMELLRVTFFQEILDEKLILLNEDILEVDLTEYISSGPYKIIANIPYNITGAIIKQFLTNTHQPTSMTLMVQKEVAERIVVRDGKESVLSISVKVFGEPSYIKKVPARYFKPQPKVDSAILHIHNISKENLPSKETELQFFHLLKTGFKHKRKTLISNLAREFEKEKVVTIFQQLDINPKIRPENIGIETWLKIHQILSL